MLLFYSISDSYDINKTQILTKRNLNKESAETAENILKFLINCKLEI